MAAEAPADDDDAWLYGDNINAEEQRKEEINAIFDRATEDVVPPGEETIVATINDVQSELPENEDGKTEEEKPPENEEEKDSGEEDDSDDDDIQVTIGDIKPTASAAYPYGGAPVNLNIKRGAPFVAGATVGAGGKAKGIDLDTVGVINGVSMYEFNLDTIEDKPWRKPGADITDYFNYGFNEDSWKAYCEKQRKLRMDNNTVSKVTQLVPGGKDQQIPIATVNENSKYAGVGGGTKKAGPPPGRRMSGSIDVICGANSSRRSLNAKENVIQVIGGAYENPSSTLLPPTHLPPPFIPPNLSVPPPGLPGMPPSFPPPLYPLPFSQPPPIQPPATDSAGNAQYDEQFFTGASRSNFDGESRDSWTDREHRERRDRDKERYYEERRSRGGGGPEDDYKRREREEYDRRHYREREYRDRKEKYYERDYERDSRERRHRDRDKDREERHKDRDRRRRRGHEDEEEERHSSSRHKHKKSKREKDEGSVGMEGSESTQQEQEEGEEK